MTPEHKIMNECRLWCGEHDYICFRCNVGKVMMSNGRWFDTGLPSGFSDLLVLGHHGDVYFVEVKSPSGKQRDDQKQFQNIVESRGFIYKIVYSAKDLEKFL